MNRTEALAVEDEAFLSALAAPGALSVESLDNGVLLAVYDQTGGLIGVRDETSWAILLEVHAEVIRGLGAVADDKGDPPDTVDAASTAREERLTAVKATYEAKVAEVEDQIARAKAMKNR